LKGKTSHWLGRRPSPFPHIQDQQQGRGFSHNLDPQAVAACELNLNTIHQWRWRYERVVTTKGTRLGAIKVCNAVPYRLRQVNAGLKFTLYCRATTATEVLAAEAAATI